MERRTDANQRAHPENQDELYPLFDEICHHAPYWLAKSCCDIAEGFTRAAFTAHGVGVESDGFRYAGTINRKVD